MGKSKESNGLGNCLSVKGRKWYEYLSPIGSCLNLYGKGATKEKEALLLAQQEEAERLRRELEQPPKKDNTMLYVGIGLSVGVLGIAAIVLAKAPKHEVKEIEVDQLKLISDGN